MVSIPTGIRHPVSVRLCRGAGAALLLVGLAAAQEAAETPPSGEDPDLATLKRLPLEKLITAEDIRRAGTTNLPDTLRLATGLHVAQFNGHEWAISARGFNILTANKMQVVMDGRNLYTPLYSGVFWDVQHTFLPDIEQIEVIRGPGATLWGANAVNGVINFRTKSAKDTQGFLLQTGTGPIEHAFGGLRYGGRSGDTFYRFYFTGLDRESLTTEAFGTDAGESYRLAQAGFRIDSDISDTDVFTLQGDIYTGRFGQIPVGDVAADGNNIIARWTRQQSAQESMMLQAYWDRTHRQLPGVFSEQRNTFDLEWQQTFPLGRRQLITWGLNARISHDDLGNLGPFLAFLPDQETVHLYSGYLQDEIEVIPDILALTIGSKLEWNSFSGVEVQPSARFAWTPSDRQTIWGAVSRAVRTPSRIDQDFFFPNPAVAAPALQGSRTFHSERLIAYELGHRMQWSGTFTTDLALFYHDYSHLRSQEPLGAGAAPFTLANLYQGESYGAELNVKWQPASWWQIDAGYTLMDMNLRPMPGSRDPTFGRGEGNDPNHILVLRSWFDLPSDFEFDATLRYVDRLPAPYTPAYATVDLRLGWRPRDDFEISVVGRNLLDSTHPEYRGGVTREIGRSIYFMFTWNY
jgi:iron complex outermembrane recepter protein